MTIKQFIHLVDIEVRKIAGVSIHDIADIDFYNYFNESYSTKEAENNAKDCAIDALIEEGFPFEEKD